MSLQLEKKVKECELKTAGALPRRHRGHGEIGGGRDYRSRMAKTPSAEYAEKWWSV